MSVTLIGQVVGHPKDRVAIKVPVSQDPLTLARFHEEAALLRGLDHPSIVRFRSSGESELQIGADGTSRKLPWLAMDFITGQSLRQRIKANGVIPWSDVRKLLGDVVEALDYLHRQHLCHRDIKPDNIIFDPRRKRWVLVDFGIAKAVSANPRLTVTLAAQGPGSWDYMSPEQLDGKPVDTRTDIYSLGKTAWEALIGTVPRVGTPFPGAAGPIGKVPTEVDTLIAKMVAHRPEDRYSSPKEVAEALAVGALRIERRRRLKATRKKVMVWTTTIMLIIALALGGWFAGNYVTTNRATDLYVRTKESPTRALRELELRRNRWEYRLCFWGRKYLDAKINELRPAADEQRSTMGREYEAVLRDLERTDRDDDYKAARARNFTKKYEDFSETAKHREIAHRADELDQVVQAKKEDAEATTAIAKANERVDKGQVKVAIDLLDDFLKGARTPSARQRVQVRRAEILDLWIADRIMKIGTGVKTDDPTSLTRSEAELKDLQREVGTTTPEISRRLSDYDRILWDFYHAKGRESLANKKYNPARAYAEQYKSASRVGYHNAEADDFVAGVTAKEDDTDWRIASQSARQNLEQKAFPLAVKDVCAYEQKWPSGRHRDKAASLQDEVATAHFEHMRSLEDIDAFNEALSVFREIHPREQQAILALRRHLCWIAHRSVWKIVTDRSLDPSVRMSRLNGLDFKQCEPDKVTYLNDLVNRATGYLNHSAETQWWWYFLWAIQRPPGDCVRMTASPTVYELEMTQISLNMEASYYEKLKGWNNANPHIHFGIGSGTGNNYQPMCDLLDVDGPVNTQSFNVQVPKTFWIDINEAEKLWIRVTDGDCGATGSCLERFATIESQRLARSGDHFDVQCDEGISVRASWSSR